MVKLHVIECLKYVNKGTHRGAVAVTSACNVLGADVVGVKHLLVLGVAGRARL